MTSARTPRRLAAADLVLGFGRHEVVHGVGIELLPGRVTALVGPNGSGKSTLLRALARLHAPAVGTLAIGGSGHGLAGFGPTASGPDARQDAGTAPAATLTALPERDATTLSPREFAREVTLFAQTRGAPQGLSVREVVAFGRHPYRKRFSGQTSADRAAVDHAMAVTGVAAMGRRAVGELSGGELQRVWLATCLAQETGVVLLDEPTNHLDLRYQVETLDIIRDLADHEGVAVGVVLHDLDHAASVADSVLLLAHGEIRAAGTPRDVLTAANISAAYGLRVDVTYDERSGRLRIDPVSRHRGHHARSTAMRAPSPAPAPRAASAAEPATAPTPQPNSEDTP